MTLWDEIKSKVFDGESGGDYNALYGYANRKGPLAGTRVSDMTINDVLKFTDPNGPYAQSVKGQIGRVATPVGAYQVVGSTLRDAVKGLGLTGTETFNQATQDAIGKWVYDKQGTGAWSGYRGPQSGGNTQMGLLTMSQPGMPNNAPQTLGQRFKQSWQNGSMLDNLTLGLNSLRMNPDQGLAQRIGARQEKRQSDDATNRTIAWLKSLNTPQATQAAAALEAGSIDAGNAVQMALTKEADNSTALQQNIKFFMAQGMSFQDAVKAAQGAAGGTTVNVGGSGIDYGNAPKEMAWARNEDGSVKLDGRGIPIALPIQNTPLATDAEKAATAAKAKETNNQVYGDAAISAIDSLVGTDEKPGALVSKGLFDLPQAGIVGSALANMGVNQEAVDVKNTLDTITSNIAFSRLQAMRDASATGGALGAVSENELALLMNSLGAVKQNTSPEKLVENLKAIKRIWIKINNDPVARNAYYGGAAATAPANADGGDGFAITGSN